MWSPVIMTVAVHCVLAWDMPTNMVTMIIAVVTMPINVVTQLINVVTHDRAVTMIVNVVYRAQECGDPCARMR